MNFRLRHFADEQRRPTPARIVAFEVADHPPNEQLLALGREHVLRQDQMTGAAPPPSVVSGALAAACGTARRAGAERHDLLLAWVTVLGLAVPTAPSAAA